MGFRNLRIGDETGIAMVLALAVLLVATLLAAVAATGAIRANHQSLRDRNSKRAFQAAVAGVQSGNYQATLMQPAPTRCVTDTTGTLTTVGTLAVVDSPGAWCPAQTKEVGDGATYTQYVSEGTPYDDPATGQHLVFREIVSTGTANGVTRRVSVRVNAASAAPLFPTGYAVVSLDPVNWGNAMTANGNVGSNGSITLSNGARILGDAITGPPHPPNATTTSGTALVSGSRINGNNAFNLGPVDQGTPSARVQNNNHRIDNAKVLSPPNPLPYPGGRDSCTTCSKVSWDQASRVLALSGDATLTLTGTVYSFCKVTLRNSSQIQVPAGARVKIYMDTPDSASGCTGSGSGSVTLSNSSGIVNLNPNNASALQLYMVGSTTIPTTLDFGNAFSSDIVMAIYAPNSSVHLENAVHLTGALAAKSIPIDNSATITYDPRIGSIVGGGIPVYRSTRSWRECTTKPTGAAVNSGCWSD